MSHYLIAVALFLPYRHPVVPGGRMYSGEKHVFFWMGNKKKKYFF
jgi:hypothetical protein